MNTFFYSERQHSAFDQADSRITWGVQRLILLNVVIFAVQLLLDIPFGLPMRAGGGMVPPGGALTEFLAFQPSAFYFGAVWKAFT